MLCFKKAAERFKNLLKNVLMLLINTCMGILYRITRMSINRDAIWDGLLKDINRPLVEFQHRSINSSTNWFPFNASRVVLECPARKILMEHPPGINVEGVIVSRPICFRRICRGL